jgi:pimeloyl-ACP methyl ester carboxylesterase
MSLPHFRTGCLDADDGAVKHYVVVQGYGPTSMVVLPGAADGLRTCVDVAVYLAWFYRERVKNGPLLILSRREPLPPNYPMEMHAADMLATIEQLDFGPAVWECLSAAGPIGQRAAVQRTDLVRGLVLASSYDHVSGRLKRSLQRWLDIARQGGDRDPFWSLIEPKYRPPADVLAQLDPSMLQGAMTPRSPERLQHLLEALLDLDQRSLVTRIACPTLVAGGEEDRSVPAEVQREMAGRISGAQLKLFPGYGHFNDMENPEYQLQVMRFAKEVMQGGEVNDGSA